MQRLLAALPSDLPAAIVVVQHLSPSSGGALPRILERAGPFGASFGTDGEPLRTGHIHVAPPDRHLLVVEDRVKLSNGPRQNGHRPAADPMFFSLALGSGRRAAVTVLSGVLDDGSAGAVAVAAHGGGVFVQDPKEALYQGMPLAAIESVPDATVEPLAELAGSVASFLHERAAESPSKTMDDPELARRLAVLLEPGMQDPSRALGEVTGLHCPACGGPIFEAAEPREIERYECLVGHSWGGQSFLQGQREQMESALRLATEHLVERVNLTRRLAEHAERGGRTVSARMFEENAERTEQALLTIRQLLDRVRETLDGESVGS